MFVYRFKIPPEVVETNEVKKLLTLLEFSKTPDDRLDLLPSKTDIMFAATRSITDGILLWAKSDATFSFEFEEHNDEWRTLTQIFRTEDGRNEISTHFLLPLFPFEFYLTL